MRRRLPGPAPLRRLAAGACAAVALLGGCTSQQPAEPEPQPAAPEPTTLESYDTSGVRVVRSPFCDRLSPTGVEHALGDPPERSTSWQNGDRVRLPDGSRDRVHEYGCAWTAGDGTSARAWVFVPPVTPGDARRLVGSVVRDDGCETSRDTPFGRPSVTARCTDDRATERSHRGLFGDAWLTCTLAEPEESAEPGDEAGAPAGHEDLDHRASEWCVAVLEAAAE